MYESVRQAVRIESESMASRQPAEPHHAFPANTVPTQALQSNRRPLQQRSDSEANWNTLAAIRLVPKTPPRLLGRDDSDDAYYYSRTPLPTHSSHILSPRKDVGKSTVGASEPLRKSPIVFPTPNYPAATYPSLKPSVKKRQLHIHHDKKTFSLTSPGHEEPESESETNRERAIKSVSPTWAPSSTLKPRSKPSSNASLFATERAMTPNTLRPITPKISDSSCDASKEIPNSSPTTSTSNKSKSPKCKESINSSPCNYEFVGGLRKVAKSPEHKSQTSTSPNCRFPHHPISDEVHSSDVPYDLSTKSSFSSTESNCSETTNYKTYGHVGSPVSPRSVQSLISHCSIRSVSQRSSPGSSSLIYRPSEVGKREPKDLSPASSSAEDPSSPQQSLIVSPLVRKSRKPVSKSGFYHSTSRESLRTVASIASLSSFLIHQESLREIISTKSLLQIPLHTLRPNRSLSGSSSWAESLMFCPPRSHMNEHPHQWSSQLSTVLSVSEDESDRRSVWSEYSRISYGSREHMMSGESGLMSPDPLSPVARSMSWSGSMIDQPPNVFSNRPRQNSSSSVRMIREQDEHGDGITDLQYMGSRPLRRRRSAYYSSASSENERTNTMRSNFSTKSNSLNLSLLPAWAKIYYGSGERYMWCGSVMSGLDSRTNSIRNDSAGFDFTSSNLPSPRRRTGEIESSEGNRLRINSIPYPSHYEAGGQLKSPKLSNAWSFASVWSPHLRHNSRIKRPCIWGPPSGYSTKGGMFERRNLQVIMFIVGFLFPFSWMIAAMLPLPRFPDIDMFGSERSSPTSLDMYQTELKYNAVEEARYESAVWWRKLNRWMSIVGVLIIACAVTLSVIGIKQGWG